MQDVQGDPPCVDCNAVASIRRAAVPGPLVLDVVHSPDCEWFDRHATLGPDSFVSGPVAVMKHTSANRGGRG